MNSLAGLLLLFSSTVFSQASQEFPEAVFLAPRQLPAGSEASARVFAFSNLTAEGAATQSRPREAGFTIRLREGDGKETTLASGKTDAGGWGTAAMTIPSSQPAGIYRLVATVEGLGDLLSIPVTIASKPVILIETDKPIYKPGQTIQGRVLLLNNALRPLAGTVDLEIRDAKQNKIDRRELKTNAFGAAPFDLPLASELNSGEWSLAAKSGEAGAEVKVRVEAYVLPRFRIEVELDKSWFLIDEPISGAVRSSYFFGKPVQGELAVAGNRLVEENWEPYARHTASMAEGAARFQLSPINFLPGEGGGAASLDFTVTDSAGHAEKTTQLVKIARNPFVVKLSSRSPAAKPGLPYEVHVEALDPAGHPVSRQVQVSMEAIDDDGGSTARQSRSVFTQGGKAKAQFVIPAGMEYLILDAVSIEGNYSSTARIYGPVAYSPSQSYFQLSPVRQGPFDVGEAIEFNIAANQPGATYFEVLSGGRIVHSGPAGESLRFQTLPAMAPEARVIAYRIFPSNEMGSDSYTFQVRPSPSVNLSVSFDTGKVQPGDPVKLEIAAGEPTLVGLAIVDESVLALGQGRLNLSSVYREIAGRFGGPTDAERQQAFAGRPHTYGCEDVLDEAGLGIAASPGAGPQGALAIPQGYIFFAGSKIQRGAYDLDDLSGGLAEGDEALAEVERVRQFFPETWVWQPLLMTDTAGRATLELTAPDSITNWKMRAVSTSQGGLGLAAGDLVVFQDFFAEPDLPFAVTRGEELWVPVAVYNYLETPQNVRLDLESSAGFEILGNAAASVEVGPNSVTGASFPIRATAIGSFPFKLTARGPLKADAVIRTLKVVPEGLPQETALNRVLKAGERAVLDASFPAGRVADSEKLLLTITGSPVAQSINGVDDLVGEPCG